MTALSTRDALAKALGQHCPIYDYQSGRFLLVCGCEQWQLGGVNRAEAERRFGEHLTDALIASGVVVDVATLADDEALIEAASSHVHAQWMETKRAQHVASRLSESGEQLMVPYEALSEAAKQLDRGSVVATIRALAAVLTERAS